MAALGRLPFVQKCKTRIKIQKFKKYFCFNIFLIFSNLECVQKIQNRQLLVQNHKKSKILKNLHLRTSYQYFMLVECLPSTYILFSSPILTSYNNRYMRCYVIISVIHYSMRYDFQKLLCMVLITFSQMPVGFLGL